MRIIADGNIPFVRECLSSVGDVQIVGGREITPKVVADADALLVRSITSVNEQLLRGSSVRFVGTATIGFDHVDVAYLERRGIGFASAPGSNANSAAEYVITALLEVARRRHLRLEGKSIGVIGVGNVGSRVASKCEALGMEVRRNDPPLARSTGILPVAMQGQDAPATCGRDAHAATDPKYVPLEALYDCDFITFHTPLTREGIDKTFHLADGGFFSRLKAGAVLVNASRGAVVDSQALKAAIQAGRLQAVVLDVWEGEPSVDVDLLEKVDLATPHIAGYSFDGKVAGMIMIYRSLCEHFGLTPKHDVKDFLPAPTVPRLEVETGSVGSEKGRSGLYSSTKSLGSISLKNGNDETRDARPGFEGEESNQEILPPQSRPDLPFSDPSATDEELLACVVERIYSISQDDRNTRQIADQPAEERGRFFDSLRKNYPVRREFQNTTVVLDRPRESLARKLRGIGFVVDADS
ncbi:MAG: 4-phosphoerythronate dehydrogenase [Phycisphaerae bacterium]|nr:4-phosphoerythronate dehydrogenase [Phycisphaerae bacterium]